MNEIKLKPCPFCGGRAEIDDYSDPSPFSDEVTYFFVRCSRCYCRPFRSDYMYNIYYKENRGEIINEVKQELAEQWNRRTENEID